MSLKMTVNAASSFGLGFIFGVALTVSAPAYAAMWLFLSWTTLALVPVTYYEHERGAARAIKQILWWSNNSWAGRSFRVDIKSGYFIGCNLEEKSKPIRGMRRNELVDVRGWRRWWRCWGLGLQLTYLRLQLWLVLVWRSSWVHSVVKRLPISLNYIIMQRTSLLTTNRICFHLGYIYFLNRLKS